MKIVAVLFGCLGLSWGAETVGGKPWITGVRTWKFVDGGQLRHGVAKVTGEVVEFRGKDKEVPLSQFVPEQREVLEALRDERVEIVIPIQGVTIPMSAVVPENDPEWLESLEFDSLSGRQRTWTSKDGRSVTGALVNLTDDEIHLLIQGNVRKVGAENLSPEDRAYLALVLKRKEELAPRKVRFARPGLSISVETPAGDFWIPFERFANPARKVNSDEAVRIASEKLSAHLDRKHWQFDKVYQEKASVSGAKKGDEERFCYTVVFTSNEARVKKLQEIFPFTRVHNGFHLAMPIFDDGELPEATGRRGGR